MKPFLKIDKQIVKLNDTCAYLYMILIYAKYKKKEISRSYLAECLGVATRESDYITHCLKEIEQAGLIRRCNKFTSSHIGGFIKQTLDYELIYTNYFMITFKTISNDNIPPKLLGFVLKLRTLCFDNSLRLRSDYNKQDIAKYMGVSASTLKKKLDALKALNIISEEKVIICSEEYFPTRDDLQNKLKPEYTDQIREILNPNNKDFDPASRLYKQFTWFVKNYIYMQKNANDIYNQILAGTLDKEEIPVEQPQINYVF